jgi:hypothetical protein
VPPFEHMDRREHAVYWEKTGQDGYNNPTLAEPRELKVRWTHRRREGLSAEGTTIAKDADLLTDEELIEGSIVWEGRLAEALVGTPTELFQVTSTSRSKDLKGRVTGYGAGLTRYGETLPEDVADE